MNDNLGNLHATAIRIGGAGILFVGPSASAKSELAFSFLVEANRCNINCALIADDQVFIHVIDNAIYALRPQAIANLLELRGSGIISVPSEEKVEITFVITSEHHKDEPRLPPENESYEFANGAKLPLLRIPLYSITPYGKFEALVKNLLVSDFF